MDISKLDLISVVFGFSLLDFLVCAYLFCMW